MKDFLISIGSDELERDTRSYHHGDLRNALLASALEILESDGLDAMSLRAVARNAGVSQAAPYHHFKDKRAIMAAIATSGHIKLAEMAREYRDRDGKGYASLIRMGGGYVAFAKDNPNLFRLMFGPELTDYTDDEAYQNSTKLGVDMIMERLASIMDVDEEAEKDEIERSGLTAWCFVHGLATLIVDNKIQCPDTSTPEFLDFIFKLFTAAYSGQSARN